MTSTAKCWNCFRRSCKRSTTSTRSARSRPHRPRTAAGGLRHERPPCQPLAAMPAIGPVRPVHVCDPLREVPMQRLEPLIVLLFLAASFGIGEYAVIEQLDGVQLEQSRTNTRLAAIETRLQNQIAEDNELLILNSALQPKVTASPPAKGKHK